MVWQERKGRRMTVKMTPESVISSRNSTSMGRETEDTLVMQLKTPIHMIAILLFPSVQQRGALWQG